MRTKYIAISLLAALCAFTLFGCQLAVSDMQSPTSERLIGIYVTTEHLALNGDDLFIGDNLGSFSGGEIDLGGNAAKYQERLYATLKLAEDGEVEHDEYVFEEYDGISFFAATMPANGERDSYISSTGDDCIWNPKSNYAFSELEEKIELEGTIKIVPGLFDKVYYVNPVYQSSDGGVYALTGNGFSFNENKAEGKVFGQTFSEALDENDGGKIKKYASSIKFSLETLFAPEKIAVLQMNAESALLSREEHLPGALPEKLSPKKGTQYIIVETHRKDADGAHSVKREIFDRTSEGIGTYFCNENGVCENRYIPLEW